MALRSLNELQRSQGHLFQISMQNDDNRCNMYPLAKSTFFGFAFVCSHNGVKWTVGRHFLLFTRLFQRFSVNLYKEYSYLILNKLEGLPCFGVMIWQPS